MADFTDIIEQERIKEHLQNSLRTGNVSHAYIIDGEKDSGKEFITRIFAKTLICEDRTEKDGLIEPCGKCHSCIQADNNDNPDIITVLHEKPSSIGVDDIRSQVNNSVIIKPYSADYKVYIIPECEKMTQEAQNALLKTLEEPPEYVVIILLTENADSFLPTIRSRCIDLSIKPVSDAAVRKYLMEHEKIVDYRAATSVAFARGNIGKAIMIVQNENMDDLCKATFSMIEKLNKMNSKEIVDTIKENITGGDEDHTDDFLQLLLLLFRDVMVYKTTQSSKNLIFSDSISYISTIAKQYTLEGLQRIAQTIEITNDRIRANVNKDIALEVLMLKMKENL